MPVIVKGVGPTDAKVMIIGEHPYVDEERKGVPFSGSTGQELTKMLHEAGIAQTECYLTYVYKSRPFRNDFKNLYSKDTPKNREAKPELIAAQAELFAEIRRVSPSVIIVLGDGALWAVTGERGITKWRGSLLLDNLPGITVIPTYDPVQIMRVWQWRFIAVQDLRRAARQLTNPVAKPEYDFIIRPSYEQVVNTLVNLCKRADDREPLKLSVDIETRTRHIACLGLAWSSLHAICIPFMCVESIEGYFTEEEELHIIQLLGQLLTHPNVRVIGQNFLYDLQYICKHWGFIVEVWMDTMIAQAVCWPGMQKALDFISSMYCEYHVYWKDDSKDWAPDLGEEQLWIYNCVDCVTTYECSGVLSGLITKLDLVEPYEFEMSLVAPLLRMMLRGVKIDLKRRDEMMWELQDALQERAEWFTSLDVAGGLQLVKSKTAKAWYDSPTQQSKLFYGHYGVPMVRKRGTGRPTSDDEALKIIAQKEPLLAPVCDVLAEYRSLGVFLNTFVRAPLDHDKRMRCSYNPVGTETFRFNSKADAFGFGTNLQNIPKGGEK